MNPEKIAMLAPKSVDMHSTHGGQGGVTPEDIAAAMHALEPLEWELLTVKYCGGKPHKLYAHVMLETCSDEISQMAIVHVVGHNTCPKCNGVKEVMVNDKKIVCHQCNGSGKYYSGEPVGEIGRTVRWLQQVEALALDKVENV